MNPLVLLLTRADLRAAPGRAAAVAALLLTAALLPAALSAELATGAVLAATVAAAATAGATAQHRRRREVLALNGAGRALEASVAAAAVVFPGLAAAAVATVVGLVGGGASPSVVVVTLVVPVVVASVTALAASPAAPVPRRGPRWRRALLMTFLVVLLAPTVVAPVAAVAALIGSRFGRARTAGYLVGSLVAVALAAAIAGILGESAYWFQFALSLVLLGPPLVVAVAWLGPGAAAITAGAVRRLGPTARLAVIPLAERRSLLVPLAAVVAVVTALAALHAVVGASFDAREAARTSGRITGWAGTAADQVIAVTSLRSPEEVQRAVTTAVTAEDAGAQVEAIVIDQLGTGGTGVAGELRVPYGEFLSGGLQVDLGPRWRLAGPPDPLVPAWVGVVDPADLDGLGLAALTPALARGDAIVLDPTWEVAATARIEGEGQSHELPAVPAPLARPALRLPAVLVSPQRAAAMGTGTWSARVVVRGVDPRVGPFVARSIADDIYRAVHGGLTLDAAVQQYGWPALAHHIETEDMGVVAGDEPVQSSRGGPLNEVPFFAGTRERGWGQLVLLGTLAVLVALAGTVLALGVSRLDDAVLDAQGAEARTRTVMAAIQAAVLTGSAALLAAGVGVGLPALAFSRYNAQSHAGWTTDIPLVVPWELFVGLAALPLLAAGLAAAVTSLRPPPSASALDDLAW